MEAGDWLGADGLVERTRQEPRGTGEDEEVEERLRGVADEAWEAFAGVEGELVDHCRREGPDEITGNTLDKGMARSGAPSEGQEQGPDNEEQGEVRARGGQQINPEGQLTSSVVMKLNSTPLATCCTPCRPIRKAIASAGQMSSSSSLLFRFPGGRYRGVRGRAR